MLLFRECIASVLIALRRPVKFILALICAFLVLGALVIGEAQYFERPVYCIVVCTILIILAVGFFVLRFLYDKLIYKIYPYDDLYLID